VALQSIIMRDIGTVPYRTDSCGSFVSSEEVSHFRCFGPDVGSTICEPVNFGMRNVVACIDGDYNW
jgi:hypothetical protein